MLDTHQQIPEQFIISLNKQLITILDHSLDKTGNMLDETQNLLNHSLQKPSVMISSVLIIPEIGRIIVFRFFLLFFSHVQKLVSCNLYLLLLLQN